jgi:hypothetical protein
MWRYRTLSFSNRSAQGGFGGDNDGLSQRKERHTMIRKRLLFAAVLTVCLFGVLQVGLAEDDAAYKSDFIVKLVDYVTWPSDTGADGVTIGVMGESPLLAGLKAKAAEKSSAGKKITVRAITLADPVTDCQIVFIPTTDKAELAKIFKKIGTSPVLTVSDCQGFAGFGVIINFFKEEGSGKIKFEVNTMAAGDVKLKISSQLLKLAKIV